MKLCEPRIFRLASTCIDPCGERDYLTFLGVPEWKTDAPSDGEELIEISGRRCYRSWETESSPVKVQNPNLERVRSGNKDYLSNILRSGHGSVLEHSYVTYAIEGVSRVFTHEMVRHRLCNFSQESLRFVRPTSLHAYIPRAFLEIPDREKRSHVISLFKRTVTHLEEVQKELTLLLGMDEIRRAFSEKKKLQSAMRRLLPMGMATGIIVTANHRNWRHMIQLRTSPAAEEEIRYVFLLIAEDLKAKHPNLYQDLVIDYSSGECTFEHGRI